jgi:hypothetical protein
MAIIRLCTYKESGIVKLGTLVWSTGESIPFQPVVNAFDATVNYPAKGLVFHNDDVYQSKNAVTAGSWDPTQWRLVAVEYGFVTNYDPTETYQHDEFVMESDRLYRSKDNMVPITGPWDAAKWDSLSSTTVAESILSYNVTSYGMPSATRTLSGVVAKIVLADGSYPNEVAPVTDPTDPVDPDAPKLKTFIGYYPSWASDAVDVGDTSTTSRKPSNSPAGFSHVKISFAHTKPVWDSANPTWDNTGLSFPPLATPAGIKEDLGKLNARGVKTYLSVGGATYGKLGTPETTDAWDDLSMESIMIEANPGDYPLQTPYTKALVDMLVYFNMDGIDLDFEDNPVHYPSRVAYLNMQWYLLKLFRFIADTVATATSKPCKVATACWSTGWDATADTNADAATPNMPGNAVSYFGDAAGRDRSLYGGYTDAGATRNASSFVDVFVNMTYDAIYSDFAGTSTPPGPFDSKYDPVVAYTQARSIITDPAKIVTIGVSNSEGFGDHHLMLLNAHCATTGPHPTFLDRDQYQNVVAQPYSLERIVKHVQSQLTTYPDDGIIQWSINAVNPTTPYTYNGNNEATWEDIAVYVTTFK